ncbi:gluconate 2-dehydrogenase subunit 3 family protein [Niabella sp. 22666]|jgi:hypothetical protein|uniref:gluconate 2-dehydrogenase subunit 3 family protein n=1 Tax=Niabella sp. 22666 TaxID=3453954 RepID=UPI003F84D134
MNRRNVIKSFFLYGLAATVVGSVFEIIHLNKSIDTGYLRSRKKLIGALSELIIPATDTPGALEANVPDYIIRAVTVQIPKREANSFIAGLKEVEAISMSKHKKDFWDCSKAEQENILLRVKQIEVVSEKPLLHKIEKKIRGASFFDTLKELTVIGFCSSEAGATRALRYSFIPKEYDPCIPLKTGETSWATK